MNAVGLSYHPAFRGTLNMKNILITLLLACVPALWADTASEIIEATGIKGGFVVHVGCSDGQITSGLRARDAFQVHGLSTDAAEVERAREYIQSKGIYGPVSVDVFDGKTLPYVDNLVNLVVVEKGQDISKSELMRVLAPRGVAYVAGKDGWKKTVKPVPAEIDDWSHYLHSAGGNAVAADELAGPPRHLQWLGSPRWSRHHDRMASMSALVSASGRMFYIMDEGSRISIQMPADWKLVGRDAFNGTILWKLPISKWHSHLWPLKSGPTQLARRLVATEKYVYATLDIEAPVSQIDAATGKILQVFEESKSTEEIIYSGGAVFTLVNEGKWVLDQYAPLHNTGDQARVRTFNWNEQPRKVMGFDAESGALKWTVESVVAPLTLASDGEQVYWHDGKKVICVEALSGKEVWHTDPIAQRVGLQFNFGPKLLVKDNVVLFAGGDRKMKALDRKTGKEMWTSVHERGGYQSPEDLLVVDGKVWSAPLTSGKDSGNFTGRDMQSGEVKASFPPTVETYWFHHRCYISKATENWLMPSRTGIEFIDFRKEDWTINHWVRGGCLYGVMPCNGMVYAPPHNCACYPEAKLYGMNALAPASKSRELPKEIDTSNRFVKGPAYETMLTEKTAAGKEDWPTYRHDAARSGATKTEVPTLIDEAWNKELGGRLSAIIAVNGTLYVSKIDEHTVVALDAETGDTRWTYTVGGRVDSPPTYYKGRLLFGSADGWVYCVSAKEGALAWKFRAAPMDRRLMSLEQLESVWPVHGNILVQKDLAYFVAGRSLFLDGGIRWYCMNPVTGEIKSEHLLDDRDPETGNDLQDRIETLQMPVGLTDILSSDGKYVYMRSQQFDLEGTRIDIGPHSGDPAKNASVQKGPTAHLFSPTGFLDDSWFHRSYWVYGRSFSGGHNGYHQAGKFAPGGRIMSFDDEKVYAFGRKPEYLKWTTTLEHTLYAADKKSTLQEATPQPGVLSPDARRGGGAKNAASIVSFKPSKSLDPADKAIVVEAWVKPGTKGGVIIARGGPADGFALSIEKGLPTFHYRSDGELVTLQAKEKAGREWVHVVGSVKGDKSLALYINGDKVAEEVAITLIAKDPIQGMSIAADELTAVGTYKAPFAFKGAIDEVRVYFGEMSDEEVHSHFEYPHDPSTANAKPVLICSLDGGKAQDSSSFNNHGEVVAPVVVQGKVGDAIEFAGLVASNAKGPKKAPPNIEHSWDEAVPLLVRSMVKSGDHVFVAGPPDIIDEEETFKRLTERDPDVQELLAKQNEALEGKMGGILQVYSAVDGYRIADYKMDSLPAWDGMAAAGGQLFMTTEDGKIRCYKEKR
jgi:outer membrane protein assembly factor BamB